MPPSSGSLPQPIRDARNQITGGSEPYYTNEDIAVLHDIVVLAQELLPSLPEREKLPTNALFGAYYDILPKAGVNSDHDNRYARILFKIGGLRGQGTLYEKFEEILLRMGIEIEFDPEDPEELQCQPEDSQAAIEIHPAAGSIPQLDERDGPRGRRRRNSDGSGWDHGNELRSKSGERRNSLSFAAEVLSRPTNSHRYLSQEGSPAKPQPAKESATTQNENEGGLDPNLGTWLDYKQGRPRKERGRSLSTHASIRIRRRSLSITHGYQRPITSTSITTSDGYQRTTNVTSPEQEVAAESIKSLPEHPLSQPSGSLMQIKASLILEHHLGFLAKRQLRYWREKALQLREDNASLELVAKHRDKEVLLHQALETWHNRLQEKGQVAETERFFAHIERRAVRARDLFLMHKAFSHWTESALQEIRRTSIARRHILRTRIFNAWQDITAVNELKTRRQRVKKFFRIWKRECDIVATNYVTSVQLYEDNLVAKICRRWVWGVWHKTAANWSDAVLKQRSLLLWKISAQTIIGNRRDVVLLRRLKLARDTLQIWRVKTNEHVIHSREAAELHLKQICCRAFKKWGREMQVIPAKTTLQSDVALRLIQSTFALWIYRSRQEKLASAIDRARILRGAWTKWRHNLRFQVFRLRVDGRVISEVLYKWVLTERLVLSGRLRDQRLLRTYFQRSVRAWTVSSEQSWNQETLAQNFAIQKSNISVLRRWYLCMQSRQELETRAVDFRARKLLRGTISHWSERSQGMRQLQLWSRDADFYFLASRSMKQWKYSTESAKREKRKAAYAQVRRMTKMNLARGMLHGWRYQARQLLQIESQASEIAHNRNIISGMNIFDRWRARTEELAELEYSWRENVLSKTLLSWKDRSAAFRSLKAEAIIHFAERRQSRSLKKWSLRTLQLRSQSHYASGIREKNLKRTVRKIFIYWQQRKEQKRLLVRVNISERAEAPVQPRTSTRAEGWSDFGDELEIDESATGLMEPHLSTLVPGYLTTPSKRTERVMAAAVRFASTTPRAPLSTPFERRLRAQYSGGVLPPGRKVSGKPELGTERGFEDIPKRR